MSTRIEHTYMQEALKEAQKAYEKKEVPVGAVIIKDDQIIARAHNQKEAHFSSCAHAEILAIQEASKHLQNWRLTECTLYVTLEPCIMCAGAILAARIKKLYFSTPDPKGGGVCSLYQILSDTRLNHQVPFHKGLLEKESSLLLKKFFKEKRAGLF
ncbi:MAG: nucleoside deaminase [Bdellovibrio sp.]|nr:MAG: nucleoside deaminase [Bdellovibrio sp.]